MTGHDASPIQDWAAVKAIARVFDERNCDADSVATEDRWTFCLGIARDVIEALDIAGYYIAQEPPHTPAQEMYPGEWAGRLPGEPWQEP